MAIFERWTPAGGPTGRSSAVCRAYYTNTFLAAAARDSIAMMERFREITGADAGFRRTGMLFLHPPEDVDDVEASAERSEPARHRDLVVRPGRFVQEYPSFDASRDRGRGARTRRRIRGSARDDRGVLPSCRRARSGREAGRARRDAWSQRRRGVVVTADDGTQTSCGRVLIAAGPWTRPLAAQVGADLPLTVERHVVATFRWARRASRRPRTAI